MKKNEFRQDINGLRAVAVLAVVIFHYNKNWLTGGFAGVDVFFVISGFLMTSIIMTGIKNNTFSLMKFYISRAMRIIPALLVMVLCLTVIGYFFFSPNLYLEFSKHAEKSLLFLSNFTFWKESGYFDSSAGKLLLHTWSLSVEWQFYLIYPIVLLAMSKLFSSYAIKKIILISVFFSFSFAVYASYKWPTASYFLIPTRSWEMLLGGLAFFYTVTFKSFWKKNICLLSGFFLILLSFFLFSANTVWPSYYALSPTVGAFLVILSCSNSLITNNLFFQKIGLWSYSLYLYHWPILAINYIFGFNLNFFLFLVISFIISISSYYFIEVKKWKITYTLLFAIIALIFLFVIQYTNGIDSRLKKNNINKDDYKLSMILGENIIGKNSRPEMNYSGNILNEQIKRKLDAVLIGDSYAAHYSFGISESINKPSVLIKWVGSCLNLPDYFTKPRNAWQTKKWSDECRNNNIKKKNLMGATLIISQDWTEYENINEFQCKNNQCNYINTISNNYELLNDQLTKLVESYRPSPVVLIGKPPIVDENTLNCLKNKLNNCKDKYTDISPKIIEMNNFLRNFANKNGIYFIDIPSFLCIHGKCKASIDGYSLYYDTGHFSAYGSRYVWNYIENELIKKGLINNSKLGTVVK